jgi:hypothetical protein
MKLRFRGLRSQVSGRTRERMGPPARLASTIPGAQRVLGRKVRLTWPALGTFNDEIRKV